MAIQLGVTVELDPAPSRLLRVSSLGTSAVVDLAPGAPAPSEPRWARLVAELASLVGLGQGGSATVTSSVPVGAGLASSAAFEVAMALAMGLDVDPVAVARLCQRAEQAALGVPCGLMDQLASAAGVAGHALLIDFAAASVKPVPVPEGAEFFVVDSGQPRALASSGYAERRAQCEAAAAAAGPLPTATAGDLARIADPLLRRRARHVASECRRVRQAAAALSQGDLDAFGQLMAESHRSLASDFEVSTPALVPGGSACQ
jgi:galactokinase